MRTILHRRCSRSAPRTAAVARDLQQVLNTGTLRVGVVLYAPWAVRAANGELAGFEVDVATQLAADMGVKAEILRLRLRKADPGARIRRDRHHRGGPRDHAGARAARELQPAVRRERDLDRDAVATHGVCHAARGPRQATPSPWPPSRDSVAVELARRVLPHAQAPRVRERRRREPRARRGEVDAYLEDEPVPTFLALEHAATIDVPIDRPLLASRAGFAVNKGDPDFLAFLNAWITAREDGHLAADDGELLVQVAALARQGRRWRAPLTSAAAPDGRVRPLGGRRSDARDVVATPSRARALADGERVRAERRRAAAAALDRAAEAPRSPQRTTSPARPAESARRPPVRAPAARPRRGASASAAERDRHVRAAAERGAARAAARGAPRLRAESRKSSCSAATGACRTSAAAGARGRKPRTRPASPPDAAAALRPRAPDHRSTTPSC